MAIQVQALSKRYGRSWAVRDLTFTVRPGIVTGFLGPNGAGKSTTMRSIVGLDRPTSGQALIDGRRYAQLRSPLREVGTLLDAKSAHRSRRAVDHLRTVAATHGIGRARVDEVIGLAGLESVARRKAGKFSLGMSQRLGIAVALLGDPHTLILDEPVNGLDPEGVTWMRTLLGSLAAEGRTVFLSSHLLGELALVAEHVVVIGRGELIADAAITTLTDDADRVRVRTGQLDELLRLLAPDGAILASSDGSTAEITGLPVEDVARRAAEAGIVLLEVTAVRRTLEEAYTELTHDAVEYRTDDVGRGEA
ncbi:ABC-2 type transport system ATP-binding protein [Microbacterium resistens]|uniref:ABC-2 type transport system ATP-binding protein n=1 Tax=Microbacterium resistens TaxID=156977 RepID=A0ABU1SEA7_9MICO|nr:ATP-binding cassette domain-containing protein [Microbacterium resistens]MDR6867902.1 ABC-2 type transport system ATP-binding protein [Microbacterium resistens]